MEKAKKAIQAQEMADEQAESLAAAKAAEAKAAEKRARKAKQAADATVAEAEKQAKAAKAELLRRAQEAESLATAKAAEAEAAEKRAKEAEKQMVDSNTAANPQSKRIVWECKVEGVWIPYSLDVTAALESSFSNGMKAAFAMHSGNYEVDFSTMRQRNVATSFEREVRRGELERDGRTPRISWECKIDGGWIQYPVDVAQILQTNYEKKSKARFHLNNSQYEIDFQVDKLEQVNTISGFKRRVRRSVDSTATEAPSTRNVPKTWAKNATGQNCELVPVLESSDEWRNVEEELTATLPQAKLYQVLRVQNEMLWEYFCFRKDRATKLSGGGDPNVVRVWHGTRQTDPQVICKDKADGFMMQHSRCGMWGKGIYFAARASYSHDYAREESRVVENTGFLSRFFNQRKLTVRTLILAKLVAGEEVALQPDNSLRLCPEKRGGNGRYDTVTGTTNGSKVYVVYENGRAYPEYLVTYTS
ncbi:TCDD-inducible poly [ADP-ribose] polymerase [Seminavis robusta]|uniref:Poly [ADP-ribose] polymerase n=1 Tax=Seminavis robusta TaxID=568900 RepID=A0A9N8D877_9STRA|nr:TCDD-inducible poly [ADP-ribose] polymerase [Seminavis robusta]|eukprot:Sro27_g018460.1 TCDD-inducible poly [ADP-ribose] polymerase (475) ;mRNA; f:167044-168565